VVTIWIEQYPRDFDEPTDYVSLNQLIHFCQQRTQVPVVEKLYQVCDGKLNTLTVSPFDDESKSLFIRFPKTEIFRYALFPEKCYLGDCGPHLGWIYVVCERCTGG